jgi:hypothetical protein
LTCLIKWVCVDSAAWLGLAPYGPIRLYERHSRVYIPQIVQRRCVPLQGVQSPRLVLATHELNDILNALDQ